MSVKKQFFLTLSIIYLLISFSREFFFKFSGIIGITISLMQFYTLEKDTRLAYLCYIIYSLFLGLFYEMISAFTIGQSANCVYNFEEIIIVQIAISMVSVVVWFSSICLGVEIGRKLTN